MRALTKAVEQIRISMDNLCQGGESGGLQLNTECSVCYDSRETPHYRPRGTRAAALDMVNALPPQQRHAERFAQRRLVVDSPVG